MPSDMREAVAAVIERTRELHCAKPSYAIDDETAAAATFLDVDRRRTVAAFALDLVLQREAAHQRLVEFRDRLCVALDADLGADEIGFPNRRGCSALLHALDDRRRTRGSRGVLHRHAGGLFLQRVPEAVGRDLDLAAVLRSERSSMITKRRKGGIAFRRGRWSGRLGQIGRSFRLNRAQKGSYKQGCGSQTA